MPMPFDAAVLSTFPAELGEGIAVDPITAELRWFDIVGRRKLTYDFVTKMTTVSMLPEMASAGAAIDADSELVFLQSGLWRRDRRDGTLERLAKIEAGRPDLRSNDGRTHPCGAFWCTTMALDKTEGAGSIYWFFKGELRQLYSGLTVGNAVCFAEDGSYAHFSDTPKGTIWKVATDPDTGLPTGEPAVFHQAAVDDPSGPDGAILDRDGRLYSARWGGARVDILGPDGGLLGKIDTGCPHTSCPAFCGPGLSSIAITTARDELDAAALARHPNSGRTFIVDIGCRGRLDPPVLIG